jgi:phosphoglycolate phosphatase-like HAD superfamily hydrolase
VASRLKDFSAQNKWQQGSVDFFSKIFLKFVGSSKEQVYVVQRDKNTYDLWFSLDRSMKLFVWDFHGVMEKGAEGAVLEISNSVLEKFGFSERFDRESIAELYGLRWFEYFKHLLPQECHDRHVELQQHCFEMSNANPQVIEEHIRANDYIHEVLGEIGRKHCQILISNTDPESLIFLDSIEVAIYFPKENVFAADSHQNPTLTKKDILKEFIRGKEFESIIIIGDTQEDIDLAFTKESVSYLYTHPGRPFIDCNADHKIHDLRELLKEF